MWAAVWQLLAVLCPSREAESGQELTLKYVDRVAVYLPNIKLNQTRASF
jgi:hypothetical protein